MSDSFYILHVLINGLIPTTHPSMHSPPYFPLPSKGIEASVYKYKKSLFWSSSTKRVH